MEHIDFHVGLLKGYLLATKADPQIIHALHVIVSRGVTPVSEPIGKAILETEGRPAGSHKDTDNLKVKIKRYFWTKDEDQKLTELYMSGMKPVAIADHIDRSIQSITMRIYNLGLKREFDV